jgi:hypothetical protein
MEKREQDEVQAKPRCPSRMERICASLYVIVQTGHRGAGKHPSSAPDIVACSRASRVCEGQAHERG